MKGLSGGERKRTSIGTELVTNPMILFLDEPTTGLDSFTSEKLIYQLKLLNQRGRTIIMTIHQPNSIIFQLLERIILVVEGKIVYDDHSSRMKDHFINIGCKFPDYCNSIDYCMI